MITLVFFECYSSDWPAKARSVLARLKLFYFAHWLLIRLDAWMGICQLAVRLACLFTWQMQVLMRRCTFDPSARILRGWEETQTLVSAVITFCCNFRALLASEPMAAFDGFSSPFHEAHSSVGMALLSSFATARDRRELQRGEWMFHLLFTSILDSMCVLNSATLFPCCMCGNSLWMFEVTLVLLRRILV